MSSIPANAAGEDLIYVAVDPCRLVDTRNAGGALAKDTTRNFKVSGNMSAQGGAAGGCADPKGGAATPLAISAYVLAVPDTGSVAGVLTAYPSDQPPPPVGAGSTVNFAPGQVIGNTTNIPLCDPAGCPADGEFAILARSTNQNVVVDVQGYYYASSGAGSCPADMTAVGSLCVDTYEASLWDAATGGAQLSPAGAAPFYPCSEDGSDCGDNGVNAAIFARSEAGVIPAARPTWYQAAVACANVGKRLPTAAEWQMAASGTPADGTICNSNGGALGNTGALAGCISAAGTFDMVGNLWEWTADISNPVSGTTDDVDIASFGEAFGASITTPSTKAIFVPGSGPAATNDQIGFRCVR